MNIVHLFELGSSLPIPDPILLDLVVVRPSASVSSVPGCGGKAVGMSNLYLKPYSSASE